MSSSAAHRSPLATHRRSMAAFTLVELLVVIAIIAILAGLGFSGMQGAIKSSERAQARNDVNQIASAVKAYLLEYGRLPDSRSAIAALTGDNPKKIVFFEAKAAVKGRGGLQGKDMMDPWGQAYVLVFDDDYDNKITHEGQTHLTTVIVETTGPDEKKINNVQ